MAATGTSRGFSTTHQPRPTTIRKDGYSTEIVSEMIFGRNSYSYVIRRDGHEEVVQQGQERSVLEILDRMNKIFEELAANQI